MGIYLNPGNTNFKETVNRRIYVDKSLFIEKVYKYSISSNKFLCVSRPRRFGKSTDANMLAAYFSKGCDSANLFDNLKICSCKMYEQHLNKHNVIHLNMQSFLSKTASIDEMLEFMQLEVIDELLEKYDVKARLDSLSLYLSKIHAKYQDSFIFLIDEWDCIFREFKENKDAQAKYLDFLRDLFKDQPYCELVYMTGILPIKKYGTHSALNMFDEISMLEQRGFSNYMGFTEEEVIDLCEKYDVDFKTMQDWYDGYSLEKGISIYSPRSVTSAIDTRVFSNYWSQTRTFDALREYIELDVDGLKNIFIELLAGKHSLVNIRTFQNDMTTFNSKDDVLTLLVHLGYLGYDAVNKEVYIPNNEVKNIFIDAISLSNWGTIQKIFKDSNDLLSATWNMDSKRVADYIQSAHYETSILQYNDENALAYTISLAYITAKEHYTIVREFPSGKGYADLVFIPKASKPAMIIELKYNQSVESGIAQIKQKNYPQVLEKYLDNLLLVSINYDKTTKEHQCSIELYKN